MNNDVGQSVAHRCAPRISENAGEAEGRWNGWAGRTIGKWERAGEREGSEQFVWIRDAGEINPSPAPARRKIITLSLGATSIERA